jgi:hypothetical protein
MAIMLLDNPEETKIPEEATNKKNSIICNTCIKEANANDTSTTIAGRYYCCQACLDFV